MVALVEGGVRAHVQHLLPALAPVLDPQHIRAHGAHCCSPLRERMLLCDYGMLMDLFAELGLHSLFNPSVAISLSPSPASVLLGISLILRTMDLHLAFHIIPEMSS